MKINPEYYTDAKAVQAHLGFLLLLTLSLLSKNELDDIQTNATIFIALAIPLLIISLILLPHNEVVIWRLKLGISTFFFGHAFGLISFAIIFYSFNKVACLAFSVSAFIAFSTFIYFIYKSLGTDKQTILKDLVTKSEKA